MEINCDPLVTAESYGRNDYERALAAHYHRAPEVEPCDLRPIEQRDALRRMIAREPVGRIARFERVAA
jgi:hypothetical protein